MWFSTHFLSQPVHCLSAEIRSLSAHPILSLPQNHAFTIKTSASYLEKSLWTSKLLISALEIHRTCFQLSAILFAFLQTNPDRFFWKIPTWEIILTTNEIVDLMCVIVCISSAGCTFGNPMESTNVNSSHDGYCLAWLKLQTASEGLSCFYSWAGRFESYLVANPKDRFSLNVAQMVLSQGNFDEYLLIQIYGNLKNNCPRLVISRFLSKSSSYSVPAIMSLYNRKSTRLYNLKPKIFSWLLGCTNAYMPYLYDY